MGQESKTELKRTPSLFTVHESQQTSKETTGDIRLIEDGIASMWVKPTRLDDLHPADAERYVCKLCSPPKGRFRVEADFQENVLQFHIESIWSTIKQTERSTLQPWLKLLGTVLIHHKQESKLSSARPDHIIPSCKIKTVLDPRYIT